MPKVNSTRAQYYCTLEAVWCVTTTLSKSLPFCCLEIKSKTKNIFLLRVKTPIHLFTYSLFTFILPFDNFRRTEPKRRWGHHNHQNWAYVTKRRHCCMNHTVALYTRDCLEIKRKTGKKFLLRVKTHIHLFTYSPIHFFARLSGNKTKNQEHFLAPS